jgi:hypothetical protein
MPWTIERSTQPKVRNTALNSNEFYTNLHGEKKPDIKMSQFGAEVSGSD